ncbi:MAG: hypothetical protein LBP60_09325 [Spirochaetaceae bacterium]|jgi:hypothetical protein|nr:hypothetical protein [Spirochaetaceae bacterium]
MKKKLLAGVLVFFVSTLSFGQIFRCTGELKSGTIPVSLHFVEYLQFRYLLLVGEVSIFLEESHIDQLRMILDKFETWETLAREGQIALTKTIDSVKFSEFHYNHTFFKEPLTFYFVFTGGPEQADSAAASNTETVPQATYNLYIDTTLEVVVPFRLSRETVREYLKALSPEHLAESRDVYEQQKALKDLFN